LESKRRAGAKERELWRWQGFEFVLQEITPAEEMRKEGALYQAARIPMQEV